MQAELTEVKEEYDRLLVNSNTERAALQGQVFDLEVRTKFYLMGRLTMLIGILSG